ncbi:response regulator transcription factor [Sphingomonas sp. HITSZ_GF]|uniref:response regulator transcription factor n=1 Tax=Sphingomonas sp. HITSZ_GF TaxID=3037247 RepID=UPI00240E3732|nr:response regulator transcription factor [Sphingomonas sp. HITSZ_GF]MDG2533011.1 response regulator transcription factor [Sphingomonas sp. HITSZ_GF]
MRVFLVDDHPLFRQALAETVHGIEGAIEVAEFETLAAVRSALAEDAEVALIMLDLKLPDSNGVTGLLSLKALFPQVPIAIVSAADDPETIKTAIACGAAGFVPKSADVEELSAAVETLLKGEQWFTKGTPLAAGTALTPAQAKVLDAVRRGLMNKQIAYELGISERTVKFHLHTVFRKLGAQTRAQLVALAVEGASSP